MYSTKVIEQNIERYEANTGEKLHRLDIHVVDTFVEQLKGILNDKGERTRDFTPNEIKFIKNELLMSKFDFRYWAERYGWFIPVEGGLSRFTAWASQEIVLRHMAELEEAMWEAKANGHTVDGILLVLHKARQLGATQLGQFLIRHRFNFMDHIRCMIASKDESTTLKVLNRGNTIFNHMPFWMQAEQQYNTKDNGITLSKLGNFLSLGNGMQSDGIGMGETYENGHLTECAAWNNPAISIEHNFFPTIPQSTNAFAILESTAQGRGNWWHTFTENVRKGKSRWRYVFVPWYVEKTAKYRRTPPANWEPSEYTRQHADLVERTSPMFLFGETRRLERDQMYWYETTREEYYEKGTLHLFLTNYCATPEESFQHSSVSAFSADTLEALRLGIRGGVAYEADMLYA